MCGWKGDVCWVVLGGEIVRLQRFVEVPEEGLEEGDGEVEREDLDGPSHGVDRGR